MSLHLCGATLVDLDLSGVAVKYGDFCGAQFHGKTDFTGAAFEHADFSLSGSAAERRSTARPTSPARA